MADPIITAGNLFEQQVLEIAETAANKQGGGEDTNPGGVNNFITGNTYSDNPGVFTCTFNIPYTSTRNPTTGAIEKVANSVFL
ncbi:MAG: hypothetical protein SXA11_06930 [Cyanobacteriota bacterium]|nr:hypothetical protein [Cyanobacteriota bacterium]